LRVGIIGLPQSGKTTLLAALTGAHGAAAGHHYDSPAIGVVKVPDDRLQRLAEIYNPKKVTPATVEFEDITGVFAEMVGEKGSGQAVGRARDMDVLLLVLRAFESPYVVPTLDEVDPVAEYEAIRSELLLADMAVVERRLQNIQRDLKKPRDRDALLAEQELMQRCMEAIESEEGLAGMDLTRAEHKQLGHYSFLTLKPHMCVLNIGEDDVGSPPDWPALERLSPPPVKTCAELEKELMDLDEDERGLFMDDAGLEEMAAGEVIRACFETAGLISFLTVGPDEVRSWTIKRGTQAPGAAGAIHSDFEKGFIRAEVVSFDELDEAGSWKEARSRGDVRMEGKDYVVQDGDVIVFHFSG
jgi:GTP-binding protein YchF